MSTPAGASLTEAPAADPAAGSRRRTANRVPIVATGTSPSHQSTRPPVSFPRLHVRLVISLMCAALAVVAAPARAAADAPPLVGIGEQNPSIFTDAKWQALGLKDVRVVAAYDALHSSWQRSDLDSYMAAAHPPAPASCSGSATRASRARSTICRPSRRSPASSSPSAPAIPG